MLIRVWLLGLALLIFVASGIFINSTGNLQRWYRNSKGENIRDIPIQHQFLGLDTKLFTPLSSLPSTSVSFSSSPSSSLTNPHRTCERQVLFHNQTAQQLRTQYRSESVLRWVLVDSFVMRSGNPCGAKNPCPDKLPVVAIVVMARVYQAAPYALKRGDAKKRRRKEYKGLMSDPKVIWECEYNGPTLPPSGLRLSALPNVVDGHAHTVVVRCPAPRAIFTSGTDFSGRLLTKVSLRASTLEPTAKVMLQYVGIRPCDRELVPSTVYMGVCTMFSELPPPLDSGNVVAMWTRFMLDSGAGFVVLYLDPFGSPQSLEARVHVALAHCRSRN